MDLKTFGDPGDWRQSHEHLARQTGGMNDA